MINTPSFFFMQWIEMELIHTCAALNLSSDFGPYQVVHFTCNGFWISNVRLSEYFLATTDENISNQGTKQGARWKLESPDSGDHKAKGGKLKMGQYLHLSTLETPHTITLFLWSYHFSFNCFSHLIKCNFIVIFFYIYIFIINLFFIYLRISITICLTW